LALTALSTLLAALTRLVGLVLLTTLALPALLAAALLAALILLIIPLIRHVVALAFSVTLNNICRNQPFLATPRKLWAVAGGAQKMAAKFQTADCDVKLNC
jgi:hypothetical protein